MAEERIAPCWYGHRLLRSHQPSYYVNAFAQHNINVRRRLLPPKVADTLERQPAAASRRHTCSWHPACIVARLQNLSWKALALRHKVGAILQALLLAFASCLGGTMLGDPPQIVGEHSPADPARHARIPVVGAAVQSMPSLEPTAAPLDPCAPIPPAAEPLLPLVGQPRRRLPPRARQDHLPHSGLLRAAIVARCRQFAIVPRGTMPAVRGPLPCGGSALTGGPASSAE